MADKNILNRNSKNIYGKTAVISLSVDGAALALIIGKELGADIYVKNEIIEKYVFSNEMLLAFPVALEFPAFAGQLFRNCNSLVFIMPCSTAVKVLAPYFSGSSEAPSVVVVDAAGHNAISLLPGENDLADKLAAKVAEIIGANPVITSDAAVLRTENVEPFKDNLRNLILGIFCRKGVNREDIRNAVIDYLSRFERTIDQLKLVTSLDIKKDDKALIEFCCEQGLEFMTISGEVIKKIEEGNFYPKPAKDKAVVGGIVEACALTGASGNAKLLGKRCVYGKITLALAEEKSVSCMKH